MIFIIIMIFLFKENTAKVLDLHKPSLACIYFFILFLFCYIVLPLLLLSMLLKKKHNCNAIQI